MIPTCAHKDEVLRDQLETHLSQLRREGIIVSWHDRKIPPGGTWANEDDLSRFTGWFGPTKLGRMGKKIDKSFFS